MATFGKALEKVSAENKPSDLNGGAGQSAHSSLVLTTTPPRKEVSYGACSTLCAIFFVAGVVLGYRQRRRIKRLASRVFKRSRDN